VTRLLVVANETLVSDTLQETLKTHAGCGTNVFVIAPALNTRIAFWTGDDRRARRRAGTRLALCLGALTSVGIDAEGLVADADPLLAIEDALRVFDADRIVISAEPGDRSNWLARDIVDRARKRFARPVELVAA